MLNLFHSTPVLDMLGILLKYCNYKTFTPGLDDFINRNYKIAQHVAMSKMVILLKRLRRTYIYIKEYVWTWEYTGWSTKCHTTDCTHNTFLLLQKHLTSGTKLILMGCKIFPNESL